MGVVAGGDVPGGAGFGAAAVMATWNYRILEYPDGRGYGLHEVYYDDTGKEESATLCAVSFTCDADEGRSGIIESLTLALRDATNRPVVSAKECRKLLGNPQC